MFPVALATNSVVVVVTVVVLDVVLNDVFS
jgi:hypothetical protein